MLGYLLVSQGDVRYYLNKIYASITGNSEYKRNIRQRNTLRGVRARVPNWRYALVYSSLKYFKRISLREVHKDFLKYCLIYKLEKSARRLSRTRFEQN